MGVTSWWGWVSSFIQFTSPIFASEPFSVALIVLLQEFTMLQMVLTVKQIMFAYNYADGWLIKNGKVSFASFFGGS